MQLPMKRIRKDSGLTLLEVLIAMVILSVALLILLNMAMVALSGNDWSNKTTTATQLMQQKLEQLRADVNPSDGSDVIGDYARKWTVSVEDNHLRRIDIAVGWVDIQNRRKVDSLTAFIKTDSI